MKKILFIVICVLALNIAHAQNTRPATLREILQPHINEVDTFIKKNTKKPKKKDAEVSEEEPPVMSAWRYIQSSLDNYCNFVSKENLVTPEEIDAIKKINKQLEIENDSVTDYNASLIKEKNAAVKQLNDYMSQSKAALELPYDRMPSVEQLEILKLWCEQNNDTKTADKITFIVKVKKAYDQTQSLLGSTYNKDLAVEINNQWGEIKTIFNKGLVTTEQMAQMNQCKDSVYEYQHAIDALKNFASEIKSARAKCADYFEAQDEFLSIINKHRKLAVLTNKEEAEKKKGLEYYVYGIQFMNQLYTQYVLDILSDPMKADLDIEEKILSLDNGNN